jgi:predicted outer membrane protein
MKSVLTSGKVVLADMMGDEAILKAMKTNEDDTVTAYDRAANNNCCTPELRQICENALADERRHRQWMEQTAEALDRAA